MKRFFNILLITLVISFLTGNRNNCQEFYQSGLNSFSSATVLNPNRNYSFRSQVLKLAVLDEDDNGSERFLSFSDHFVVQTPQFKNYTLTPVLCELHLADLILFESDSSPPLFS